MHRSQMKSDYPLPSRAFDLVFTALAALFTIGLFVDGWAHHHLPAKIETFFTPWHAPFYAGFFSLFVLMWLTMRRNETSGFSLRRSLPQEYMTSFWGGVAFLAGAVADMFWHRYFGIEVSLEALLSPTHLALALGGALMVAGPFRSLWHRRKEKGIVAHLPALISFALFLSFFTFMTQFAHPIVDPWMDPARQMMRIGAAQSLGLSGVLLQTALFTGLSLYVLRRRKLPFGSFAFILGLNALGMAFMQDEFRFFPAIVLAGLLIDLIVREVFNPREIWTVRALGALMPAAYWTAYTVTLLSTGGVWWSVHLWAGQIVLAGVAGLLISCLVFPPKPSVA